MTETVLRVIYNMIHELLSNNGWITPQIDYLVWLQNIRMQCGGVFDECFLSITALGELLVPTSLICIIYWCINANAGLYLFTLNSLGLHIAHFMKMLACIYRPWVLSDRVKPIESALKMSGGYSFPSGHSAMASTTWGGMAFLLRNKKIICTLLILMILLIAFSRTYVGVHTPQDVIIGVSIGLILVFVVHFLLKWCEKNKNRYLYSMVIFSLLVIWSAVYMVNKYYPMDYVDGKLLVNPSKAIYITILYSGWVMGMFDGAFLCKRFFPFDAKQGSLVNKIVRAFIGLAFIIGMFFGLNKYLFDEVWSYPVAFVVMFCLGFFITAVYPFIFTRINKMLK